MKKELISNKQIYSIGVLFIIAYCTVYNVDYSAMQDSWISVLLSIVLTIPLVFVYAKTLQYYPGKNIYEVFEIVFGKIIGKIITLLYTLYFVFLGGIATFSVINFVSFVGLPQTPKFVPLTSIGILIIYALYIGIEAVARYSELFILPIFLLIIIIIVLLIPKMNFSNLKPILYYGYKPILKSTIIDINFPFSELIAMCTFSNSFKDTKSLTRVFIYSLVVSGFVILLITIASILTLGSEYLSSAYFPLYEVVRRIEVGESIERVEIIITIIFLISEILKMAIIILAACKGIEKLFNFKDYRKSIIPITVMTLMSSYFIYNSLMKSIEFKNSKLVYYSSIFQIIVPIIVFIFIKLKKVLSSS